MKRSTNGIPKVVMLLKESITTITGLKGVSDRIDTK